MVRGNKPLDIRNTEEKQRYVSIFSRSDRTVIRKSLSDQTGPELNFVFKKKNTNLKQQECSQFNWILSEKNISLCKK